MCNLSIYISIIIFHICTIQNVQSKADFMNVFFLKNQTKEIVKMELTDLMRKTMNLSQDPCNDFYNYACGNFKDAKLKDFGDVSAGEFAILNFKLNELRQADLTADIEGFQNGYTFPWEDFTGSAPISAAEMKVRDFYQSCLNVNEIKLRGPQLAANFMQQYRDWITDDRVTWHQIMTELLYMSKPTLIRFRYLSAGNMTIILMAPARQIPKYKTVQKSCSFYKIDEMTKVLKHVGIEENLISSIIDGAIAFHKNFEEIYSDVKDDDFSDMAEGTVKSMTEDYKILDLEKLLFIVTQRELDSEAPMGAQKTYFKNLVELLGNISDGDVKKYLFLEFAYLIAEYTSDILPVADREKYCFKQTLEQTRYMADVLFLRKYFSSEVDEDILRMAENLRRKFPSFVESATWITPEDRNSLKAKIAQASVDIGYWPKENYHRVVKQEMDYFNSIVIHPKRYFQNAMQLRKHNYEFDISTLAQPLTQVDVTNINAQYNSKINSLQIFLGISEPPFYHFLYPAWAKYGRIGSVLGHEFCHAIDFGNYMYDAKHEVQKLSGETMINYFIQSLCLGRRYNDFTYEDAGNVDGAATIGENIADHAGLKLSYMAYEQWLNENGGQQHVEDVPELQLSGKQAFFVSFAQNWCDYKEDVSVVDFTDEHAPNEPRVLITLAYNKEFSEAYRCPRGSKMNPIKKCEFS